MESENKTKDQVQQFLELRQSLETERSELVERVQQIDEVLTSTPLDIKHQRGIPSLRLTQQKRNELSLRKAVIKITSRAPRTKMEILRELNAMGYIFSSATPINSLNATLYSKGQFINENGYFSPVEQ